MTLTLLLFTNFLFLSHGTRGCHPVKSTHVFRSLQRTFSWGIDSDFCTHPHTVYHLRTPVLFVLPRSISLLKLVFRTPSFLEQYKLFVSKLHSLVHLPVFPLSFSSTTTRNQNQNLLETFSVSDKTGESVSLPFNNLNRKIRLSS